MKKTIFILLTCFFCFYGCASSTKKQQCLVAAESYINADEKLLQHAAKNEPAVDELNSRSRAANEIKNVSLPSNDELVHLLKSEKINERKSALVLIFLSKNNNDLLYETMLKNYSHEADYFNKFYTLMALGCMNDSQVNTFEDMIIRNLQDEKNETLITSSFFIIVGRINPLKTMPLFVQYFKTGTMSLRKACYAYLKSTNENMFQMVQQKLEEDNASATMEHLF